MSEKINVCGSVNALLKGTIEKVHTDWFCIYSDLSLITLSIFIQTRDGSTQHSLCTSGYDVLCCLLSTSTRVFCMIQRKLFLPTHLFLLQYIYFRDCPTSLLVIFTSICYLLLYFYREKVLVCECIFQDSDSNDILHISNFLFIVCTIIISVSFSTKRWTMCQNLTFVDHFYL